MPYRNDEEAIGLRKQELERELADVKRRASEFAYLEWRAKELEIELADISKRQAAFAKKKRLPMLAKAKIASPCNADWNEMLGDDNVRFCKSCEKNVYNLSSMTSEAAEALLVEKEGKLCARFYTRADGTVLTADCPVGVRRKWVRRAGTAAVIFGSAVAGAATLAERKPCATMGDMAMGSVAVPAQEPHNVTMGVMVDPHEADPTPSGTPSAIPTTTATTPHVMGHMGRVRIVPNNEKPPKAEKPHAHMGAFVPGPGNDQTF